MNGLEAKQMVEFLWDEYVEAVGDAVGDIDSATNFRRFCRDYLAVNPVQQVLTNYPGNHGLQLSNMKVCLVNPPIEQQQTVPGSMQSSSYAAVSGVGHPHPSSAPPDMANTDAVPLTGHEDLIPPSQVDFSKPAHTQRPKEMQRYDQHDPRLPS